jgi:X-X-X-Leu-X-X-Gly heptad repeat protein
MKSNPFYIVIYIVLLIAVILASFYIIKILYMISCAPFINDVFGPARDYIIYDKQPVMWLPILVYNIINFAPLHKLYVIILCIAAFVLLIIIACWLIGLILQKIIFTNPFENIPPWRELREEGFFKWLLEKTPLEKNKDVAKFILNIFKSVLTPEQYKAAEERCLGSGAAAPAAPASDADITGLTGDFPSADSVAALEEGADTLVEGADALEEGADALEDGADALEDGVDVADVADVAETAKDGADTAKDGAATAKDGVETVETFIGARKDAASKSALAAFAKAFNIPQPYSEYIDYNLEEKYKSDGREKDLFYRNSYLSIKQRADANSYRNMNIARPDIEVNIPELPDVENIVNAEVNYVNIRLG